MDELGYASLFVASLLAATILPLGSEVLMSAMLASGFDPRITVVVATAGNWIGSMTTYALGWIGNMQRIERWLHIAPEKTEKFRHATEKYGSWFGLIVWVPGIGDVIAVCLGLVRTPIVRTAVTILVGKLGRYIVWTYLTLKGLELIQ